MIFIVVKWTVQPEHADQWLDVVGDFTRATRAEPGNLFFEWSRSADQPNLFYLVEAFADGDAGGAHVGSQHFKTAASTLGEYLAATPDIVSQEIAGQSGWSKMGEITVD